MLTKEEIIKLMQRFGGQAVTTRTVPVAERAEGKTSAVLTTELPAEVFSWERWDVITEVMLMDGMVLPQGRDQVPLLDTHSRWSVKEQFGSVRNFGATNVAGYAGKTGELLFSSVADAQEAKTKVDEGHVTDISAGYEVLNAIWVAPKTKQLINGKEYDGGDKGLQVTTQWKLKEVSLCPIGADELATIRSEAQRALTKREEMVDCPECGMQTPADGKYCKSCGKEISRAARDTASPDPITINNQPKEATMPEATKQELTDQERTAIREAETNRIKGIGEWKQRFTGKVENVDELALKAIKEDWTPERMGGELAIKMSEKGQPLQTPQTALGMSQKDKQRYSITKAIGHMLFQRDKQFSEFKDVDATFEIECSDQVAKQLGQSPKGIFIPDEVQPGRMTPERALLAAIMQRDQTVASATGGGNLVGTNLLASEYIDLPRNMYLADKIGVRIMGGLVGNIAIPKLTGAGTVSWVGESTAASEAAVTVGQVTLQPKTVSTFYDYSRKLLLNSTPSIDRIVTEDGDATIRLAIDKAIFHGTGTDQPTGIALTNGVGDVGAAGMDWAAAVEFRTDVASANLLGNNLAYVTDPVTMGVLMTREKATGYPTYLINDNGRMVNFPVYDSNQITAGYIFFGDGSQVLLGEWSVLDVLVDPYTASTKGDVRIVFFKTTDVAVRLAGAWSVADDAA